MKTLIILSIFLTTSCSSICILEKKDYSHSCPEPGHGPCFLGCDTKKKSFFYNPSPRKFGYKENQRWEW